MRKIDGSLTVEAALIIPLLLFLIVIAIRGGVDLYLECRATVECLEQEEPLDAVELFYLWKEAGELADHGNTVY